MTKSEIFAVDTDQGKRCTMTTHAAFPYIDILRYHVTVYCHNVFYMQPTLYILRRKCTQYFLDIRLL